MPDEGKDIPTKADEATEDKPGAVAPAPDAEPTKPSEPEADADDSTGIAQSKPGKPLKPSAETKPKPDKKDKKKRPEPTTFGGKLWYNWVKPIGLVVIIVVLFRSTLLDWNDVPTGSMEPEIQVGDRIAVNRLSYGFQFPLTGPTLGIPFTPIQFDNPLDGIPQIHWSSPDRGDIVTFWNPVTNVRMVKRIIGVPGDKISMTGGKLTIERDGEVFTAEYADLSTDPPRQTKYTEPGPFGKPQYVYDDLVDQQETILGLTRMIQQIKKRWLHNEYLVEFPNGNREFTQRGEFSLRNPRTQKPVSVPRDEFMRRNPQARYIARFIEGAPQINETKPLTPAELADGKAQPEPVFKQASYNAFVSAALKPYQAGKPAEALESIGLSIDGHELKVDGEAVPFELFFNALDAKKTQLDKAEVRSIDGIGKTIFMMRQALMTSFGPITLGEREYYMVGDNRNNSHDSRYFGPVDKGEITGKAFAVAFSFKDNKMFAIPPVPAWSRWFKDLD